GTNPVEVVDTGIKLMEATVQQIGQSGGGGTSQHAHGLVGVSNYIGQYMQQLSQDPENKQLVKQFGDRLGRVMNMVKAFAQRQQQAAQQQNGNGGPDPEAMVKAQLLQQQGQQKLLQKQQTHQQKMLQDRQKFTAQQQQDKTKTLQQIALETAKATAQARSQPPPSPEEASSDDQ